MPTAELPQYAQIKRRLIAQITAGTWQVGAQFPSEAQLLSKYKVSRATLVRSLHDLVREGYLTRRQGQGTFVADYVANRKRNETTTIPLFISAATYALSGNARQVLLRILYGIETALGPAHPGVNIRQVSDRTLDGDALRMLEQLKPSCAFIVEPSFNPQLVAALAKVGCVAWGLNEPSDDGNCVYIDQERAGYLATRWLLQQGRRRVALLNGKVNAYWGFAARERGYRKAMDGAGVEVDPRLVREGQHAIDSEAGRAMMRAILEEAVEVDGVVGASDSKAMGAMAAAQEAGRRLPEDIAVVSIDNTIAAQAEPPLTAVAMPFDEVGRQAALRLKEIQQNPAALPEAVAAQQIRLQPTLVERF